MSKVYCPHCQDVLEKETDIKAGVCPSCYPAHYGNKHRRNDVEAELFIKRSEWEQVYIHGGVGHRPGGLGEKAIVDVIFLDVVGETGFVTAIDGIDNRKVGWAKAIYWRFHNLGHYKNDQLFPLKRQPAEGEYIDRRLRPLELPQKGEPAPEKVERVNHPKHYNKHPSGIECIDVIEWFNLNLGNVIKYIWRAEEKGATIQDLEKAAWYLNREIERRKKLEVKNAV